MLICHICNKRNDDSLVCSGCGAALSGAKHTVACQQLPQLKTRLIKSCPACGAENEPLAGTCRGCSGSLISVLPIRRKENAAKRIFLIDDSGTALMLRADGSALGCDLLKSPYVSREHFSVSFDGLDFLLMDLGSRNGTRINGDAIKAGCWVKLSDKDIVTFANLLLAVSIEDNRDATG